MTIKELREKTGMSQGQFAKHFGISVRTVQEWEQERRSPPQGRAELLFRIYELECQIRQLQKVNTDENSAVTPKIDVYYDIGCSKCGRHRSSDFSLGMMLSDDIPKKKFAALVAKEGWVSRRGCNLCPECAAKAPK